MPLPVFSLPTFGTIYGNTASKQGLDAEVNRVLRAIWDAAVVIGMDSAEAEDLVDRIQILSDAAVQAAQDAQGYAESIEPLVGTIVHHPDTANFEAAPNGVPAEGVVVPFAQTLAEELNSHFTGGAGADLPNYSAQDVGFVFFSMPTEERMNFVAADTPWMTYKDLTTRFIPLDLRTQIPGLSIARPLFRPTVTNEDGILAFRYIGDEPLHTVMEGGFEILTKVGDWERETAKPSIRSILSLHCFNPPSYAAGQGGGRQFLGQFNTSHAVPKRIENINFYQDIGIPCGADIIQNGMENIALTGNQLGTLTSGNTFTDASNTVAAPDQVISGPTIRRTYMSSWITLNTGGGGVDMRDVAFALFADPAANNSVKQALKDSSFCRVRCRNASGQVQFLTGMSANRPADRTYSFPADTVEVQFTFDMMGTTGVLDNAANNFLKLARLGVSTASVNTPLHGLFTPVRFDVMQDVVFYPGCEYCLSLYTDVVSGAFNRDNGFRYQGGGLKVTFPAGKMKKSIAKNIYESVE